MIELAMTPTPVHVQGGTGGGIIARDGDASEGFADFLTRDGAGRAAPSQEDEIGSTPADENPTETAGDDMAARAGSKSRLETEGGEDVPSWPTRGLQKALATLFGDRDAQVLGEAGTSPDEIADASAVTSVVPEVGMTASLDEVAEDASDTGMLDDAEDAEAGVAVIAAAIILPAPPREQRPAGAGPAKVPDQPTGTIRLDSTPAMRPDETAGHEDGAQSGGERRGDMPADAGKARNAAPEAGEMKVRVLGETVSPTPGPLQNQRTIADLVATIASDGDWTSALERATASRNETASTPVGPVRDLRIQLNPAELGSVEARLRIAGDQLSVEIRVESGEAFRRLSSERDAIISSLRGLGFAVDDVSIQQQPTAGQAQSSLGHRQNDASGGPSQGTGRDQQGEGGAAGGRQRDDQQGGQNGDAHTPATRPAGGGLYI